MLPLSSFETRHYPDIHLVLNQEFIKKSIAILIVLCFPPQSGGKHQAERSKMSRWQYMSENRV